MIERVEAGEFYILCPDNEAPRSLDEKRIVWAAGDIVENRRPLSRWHPDGDTLKRASNCSSFRRRSLLKALRRH